MRIPLLLYLLALVVRLVVAAGFNEPAYPDSAYYVQVARELAAGHGLNVDFVWIFPEVGGHIPANPVLPVPSNAHWLPLASIIQVPFIWLLGPTMTASLIPTALLGALMAPIAWFVAKDAGLRPVVGIAAGVLAAAPTLSTAYMSQPENFSLFGPLVAGSLLFAGRGLRGHAPSLVLAGLLAGFAAVSRTEGWLVLGAILVAWGWAWIRRRGRVPFVAALGAGIAFVLVVTPWYVRQLAVFGSMSPSTSTGKVLYLRDFSEWNSITTPATLDWLLGMGIGPLLATRLEGLGMALGLFAVLVMGVVLVPFLLVGAWNRRGEVGFGPGYLYALFLLGFCSILTPIHVPGGQFMHSVIGLAPLAYVLAMEGARVAGTWIAGKAEAVHPERVGAQLVGALLVIGLVFAAVGTISVQTSWSARADVLKAAGIGLDDAGATGTDRVMSMDAAGIRYWTGRGGVVLVNDPVETAEAVARAYDVRWLVLDHADDVPLAAAVHAGDGPAWVGPVAWDDGRVAVYPVCTEPGDPRCGTGT